MVCRARPLGELLQDGPLRGLPVINSAVEVIAQQIDAFLVGRPGGIDQPLVGDFDAGDGLTLLYVEDGDLLSLK